MQLASAVYRATESLPKHEMYGLTGQMRRAAVSVAANIAEGNGRQHRRDYANFVSNSNGSLRELETTILLAEEIYGMAGAGDLLQTADRVGQMLTRLRQSLLRPSDQI